MKFNELKIESRTKRTRVGRGIAAGRGKTAGRGTKGQKARTGGNIRPGFAGGQSPLVQKLPKLRGFTSHRPATYTVYTGQIEKLKSKKIDTHVLAKEGLVADAYHNIKLVVKGELKSAKTVELQGASANAIEAVQAAGGTFTKVARTQREAKASEKENTEV